MTQIKPCLWFDGNAEEAAQFYAGLFPNSSVDSINRSPADYPSGKEGGVITVEFTILGMKFLGLNGGSYFQFNEAVSFQVYTEDQEETDRYWNALIADGGSPSQCSWCKDRFGLSWQIVPRALHEMMTSKDAAASKRAMQAMMQMTKIDIAALERAYRGDEAA